MCDFLVECIDFGSRVTGNKFVINFKVDFNSDLVVYLLSCARCEMQYAGSTITKLGLGLMTICLGSMPTEGLRLKIRLRMNVYTNTLVNQTIRV